MSPDFSQRYECSMSTSFPSKLRGNCPCILLPCHLSFVFSAILSFTYLVSFCTSVFRHLALCDTTESVLCWCVLTTCISGSSFLSTYSANFVISTEWAASNCIKPLPPCFLGTYKRSTSAFGWCCPWMVSSFLVFRSSFCSSSWCQLTIPKLHLSTDTFLAKYRRIHQVTFLFLVGTYICEGRFCVYNKKMCLNTFTEE